MLGKLLLLSCNLENKSRQVHPNPHHNNLRICNGCKCNYCQCDYHPFKAHNCPTLYHSKPIRSPTPEVLKFVVL